MNSEKNQVLFIVLVIALIAATVLMFLFVGGEFNFLFIKFSADGILSKFAWIIPVVMVAAQQLYIIPSFMKAYWQLFSGEPPSAVQVWAPILNESAVFQNETLEKIIYAMWAVVGGLIIIMVTPLLSFFGYELVTVMFYLGLLVLFVFIVISLIRGFQYLSVRKDIYDLHNKYMGIRGTSVLSWVHRMLYFVPLGRSISLLADMQVMDKLTKWNDMERMKTELFEEDN